jgi:hypothetical protein
MRCGACRAYIPEGLTEPITCPSCGKVQTAGSSAPTPSAPAPSPVEKPAEKPVERNDEPSRWIGTTPAFTGGEGAPPPLPHTDLPPLEGPREPVFAGARTSAPPPEAAPAAEEFSGAYRGAATAFAPYFTIQTSLSFGPATGPALLREPTPGSLSFGPEGFAIVSSSGKAWDKIRYHELSSVRVQGDSVHLVVRDIESRLTLHHPWLPSWLEGPRRSRAATVVELLGRVRAGLTPYEISLFRKRLR